MVEFVCFFKLFLNDGVKIFFSEWFFYNFIVSYELIFYNMFFISFNNKYVIWCYFCVFFFGVYCVFFVVYNVLMKGIFCEGGIVG